MGIFIGTLEVVGALWGSLFTFCLVLRLLGFRLNWFTAAAGTLFLLALAVFIIATLGVALALPALLFLMLVVGWMLNAYLRYRQARQDELLQVMTAAVEARLPLAPAIRSYVRDRPHSGEGGWDIVLLFFCPPGYWLWHQRHSFDRRTAQLAALLDEGVPLAEALGAVRGVAPREVRVAASVGGATGQLADCLRRADRDRLAGAWLELAPRLLYPLLLLLFIGGIGTFLMLSVMPRMQRIFADFGEPLPALTQRLLTALDGWDDYQDALILAVPVAVLLAVLLALSPAVRWYLPVLGRVFRWEAQGLVLRMLGVLVEVGWPAPKALQLLADTAHVPSMVRQRLDAARRAVERGEPLAAALRGAGLLPSSMAPLVGTAERTRTLPWALAELGTLLAGRAVRLARRVSLVVSPVLVAAVGLLVAFIALAMFMPLIQLLTRLSV
jgi:type IV pilus assembly protein PilC